jgi:Protein of unknown function (DUF4054)
VASSQDVIAFRLNYAEFKALKDADIATALDDADVWLDPYMWALRDFPTARALWAAHNLTILAILLAQQETMGDLMGFTNNQLRSIGFGERRVAFGQVRGLSTKTKEAGGDPFLQETSYGQLLEKLMKRNIIPIMTV